MFTSIFVLGSLAFYLLLVVATAMFFFCAENDDAPGWTVFGVVAFLLAWLLFGNLWPLMLEHPWHFVLYPIAWVVLGMLWSFPRWIIFLKRVLKEYNAAHAAYLNGVSRNYVNDHYVDNPNTEDGWVKNGSYRFINNYGMKWSEDKPPHIQPPSFAPNRKRLVAWVTLWPWSFVWTFASEVVMKGIRHVVNMFGGTYQRLSAWVFSGVK